MMDSLTRGCMLWSICILKPLSTGPLYHFRNSTLWLLSTREYQRWRCPSLSHSSAVARQMLAFESETLRDCHVPQGWIGEQIILTNMHEIHSLSDNLFSRGNFWVSQTGHEYSFFINTSRRNSFLTWLTDKWWFFFFRPLSFSLNKITKAMSSHLTKREKNNCSPLARHHISASQWGCWV